MFIEKLNHDQLKKVEIENLKNRLNNAPLSEREAIKEIIKQKEKQYAEETRKRKEYNNKLALEMMYGQQRAMERAQSEYSGNTPVNRLNTTYVYSPYTLEEAVDIQMKLRNGSEPKFGNRKATRDEVKYYMNPNNFINDSIQKYQFIDTRTPSNLSVAQINQMLEGRGAFEGQGQAFLDAEKNSGLSAVYLVGKGLAENGSNSNLFPHKRSDGTIVYNPFNIGAIDTNPINGGSKYAKDRGWFDPATAIREGAKFVSSGYSNQPTTYEARWNPEASGTNQYATAVNWPHLQAKLTYKVYMNVPEENLVFRIPVYRDGGN